jgi:hypothetical protein
MVRLQFLHEEAAKRCGEPRPVEKKIETKLTGPVIGGGLMVMVTLRGDVANIKAEVGGIQLEIRKIGDVLITQADQNRRILHLEEDFRELRHGHGFIQARGAGIEREYP